MVSEDPYHYLGTSEDTLEVPADPCCCLGAPEADRQTTQEETGARLGQRLQWRRELRDGHIFPHGTHRLSGQVPHLEVWT